MLKLKLVYLLLLCLNYANIIAIISFYCLVKMIVGVIFIELIK